MKRTALHSLLTLTVAANALFLADARAELAPVLVAQTKHFAFYAYDAKLKVKAERSERFLREIGEEVGLPYEGQIKYYRYSYPEQLVIRTGAYASGVAYASVGEIHSTQEFHAHEIVHIVLGQAGTPGTFFSEGAAVFLGDRGRSNGRDVDAIAKSAVREVAFEDLLTRFAYLDTGVSYPLAGSFVRFVARRFGTPRLADLFKAIASRGAAKGFEATLGVSLAEVVRDWNQSLGTSVPATRTAARHLNTAYSLNALVQ